ncbi:MAG: inositol 2-dehydrogenase [Anaerolineae bacterium]|nr:inositol 2-dehydrogenase [Anaerolineae bacterium]
MDLRIGLIGAGRMGAALAHHLAYSVEKATFVAVADPNEESRHQMARRLGVPETYRDHEELLAHSDVDAVVIVTPTSSHVDVVCAAAAAGKHIFVEKPLALTLAGCDEAVAAAEAAGVRLQVGFMRRFDPAYVAAKEKIDAGTIGTPVMFKSTGRDPWRTSLKYAQREASGGLILDMAIHDFDAARWLMGSDVERTYAEGGCLVFPELAGVGDIDNAVVNLKFRSGAIGNVDVSRNAIYGYDIRTEVIGSEGSLMIGGLQGTAVLTMTKNNIAHDTIPGFMERFREAYAAELRAFVDAVLEKREVAVTGRDARAATAIGIAATRSFDEQRPVALDEIEERAG